MCHRNSLLSRIGLSGILWDTDYHTEPSGIVLVMIQASMVARPFAKQSFSFRLSFEKWRAMRGPRALKPQVLEP